MYFICFVHSFLVTNGLDCADVPLNTKQQTNKQTNKQTTTFLLQVVFIMSRMFYLNYYKIQAFECFD